MTEISLQTSHAGKHLLETGSFAKSHLKQFLYTVKMQKMSLSSDLRRAARKLKLPLFRFNGKQDLGETVFFSLFLAEKEMYRVKPCAQWLGDHGKIPPDISHV